MLGLLGVLVVGLVLFDPHAAGTRALGAAVEDAEQPGTPPPIYLNQSGFDLDRPKRFTMPSAADGTPFVVRRVDDGEVVFRGAVRDRIGDFTDFRPGDPSPQYFVQAAGHRSVPFGIGPYWVERVTYQAAMDFMVQSRHYVGDVTGTRQGSYAWRDDHHFAFTAQTLAAQYLANPSVYDRMPRQVRYVPPDDRSTWGVLEPYADDAPDIVKLLHWNADVIATRRVNHALLKAQLAAFLYAYPYMSDHVAESAYRQVLALALEWWELETADHVYPYDETPRTGHNLLALDTTIGSTKGSHPPAHAILPNLSMYEVARRESLDDAEKFFDAAYRQTQWVIEHLDWHDPQTTKGQRQSEHVTMAGLVMFARAYPDRAPAGLCDKLRQWARVAVSRSDNMWDFRRLSDDQWVPSGAARTAWNEPGNVAGFAACALGVALVIDDAQLQTELERLAFAHMDNVFGRNPTGRHFSHRAPGEIEGVEYGWYSYHVGGIGALDRVTFVLDGAPKNEHYPYHPEIGDVGWTEGWVNFNTAYNMSLAMMAAYETKLELLDAGTSRPLATVRPGQRFVVRLRAPLNFDYRRVEQARVQVHGAAGIPADLTLDEDGSNSRYFQGTLTVPADARSDDVIAVSYGFGWLAERAEVRVAVQDGRSSLSGG